MAQALSRTEANHSFIAIVFILCYGAVASSALIVSRHDFLTQSAGALSLKPLLGGHQSQRLPDSVTIPLRFLPTAECLAMSVVLSSKGRYYQYEAVVDTGSPFLTAPAGANRFAVDVSDIYPKSDEQYGETIGEGMEWRQAQLVLEHEAQQVVLGVPPSNVVQDTGGIFCGLMALDDARPTFLEQLGYTSFSLDYGRRELTLGRGNKKAGEDSSSTTLDLMDLSPFGPNLHHYAVECQSLTFNTKDDKPIHLNVLRDLSRPVWVVIDTGLTSCIFSDSWLGENRFPPLKDLLGTELHLGKDKQNPITIASQAKSWYPSCFRLPWFTSESNHPHIIAAGGSFWNHGSWRLSIDTTLGKLELQNGQPS